MASLELAFDILARDKASKTLKNVGDSADKASDQVHRLGGRFGGLAKAAALGVGAAAVGAVALGKSFVDAAIESQKVTKQTDAVLKSMGDGAGVTADQVAKLSTKLSLQSGIDDELIQSGENVLLTFGKVQNKVGKGNKIFDRATDAALNMSVALGTDMQGATIQVGKALNDPIKGITALSRAGVSFTEKQKDQIKWMTKSGDVLGAQKIILGELENQFGGSAEAQASAGDRLKVVWGNLQEELGNRLLPIIETLADWLGKTLPPLLDSLGGFIQPIIDQIGMFWDALTTGFTEDEGTPIEDVALSIRDAFDAIKTWWDENGDTIKTAVGDALGHLADVLTTVGRVLRDEVVPKFQEWGAWLLKDGPGAELAITGLAGAMAAYAASAVVAASATLVAAAPFVVGAVVVAGLAWATGELVKKFDLLPKAAEGVQWVTDHVLEPFLGVVEQIRRRVLELIALLQVFFDKLHDVPGFGGKGGFDLGSALSGTPALPFVELLKRAGGGPVSAGSPYIVGEQGPEWFVPKSSGTIIPNGAGGGEVHLHVVQMPGEDQVSAGMRALRHHQNIQLAVGSR